MKRNARVFGLSILAVCAVSPVFAVWPPMSIEISTQPAKTVIQKLQAIVFKLEMDERQLAKLIDDLKNDEKRLMESQIKNGALHS